MTQSPDPYDFIQKFNPYHGEHGRFASGPGGGTGTAIHPRWTDSEFHHDPGHEPVLGGRTPHDVMIHHAAHALAAATAPRVTTGNHAMDHAINTLVAHAHAIEPETTATLERIAHQTGGHMTGLEFRFKSPDALVGKVQRYIDQSSRSGHPDTPEHAASRITDALRYTMTFDAAHYTRSVIHTVNLMQRAGYHITNHDLENSWPRGDAYNGINALFTHPSGSKVEIQFHTPQSWKIKTEVIHHPYEEFRKLAPTPGNRDRRRSLFHHMRAVSDSLAIPADVLKLGQLVHRPFTG